MTPSWMYRPRVKPFLTCPEPGPLVSMVLTIPRYFLPFGWTTERLVRQDGLLPDFSMELEPNLGVESWLRQKLCLYIYMGFFDPSFMSSYGLATGRNFLLTHYRSDGRLTSAPRAVWGGDQVLDNSQSSLSLALNDTRHSMPHKSMRKPQ